VLRDGQDSTNVPGRSWKRTTLVPSTCFLPSALCKRRLGTLLLGQIPLPCHAIGFSAPTPFIVDSYPNASNNGWIVTGGNEGGIDGNTPFDVTVHAICVNSN
jgi:hypothetical protein